MYITNNSGKKYTFEGVKNITKRAVATNITINSPGQGSDENYALNLNGIQQQVSFSFSLHERDDDSADGTHSSQVKTPDEQWEYLDNDLMTGSFEEEYTLVWNPSGSKVLINMKGLIDDLSLSATDDQPTTYDGSLSITKGKNPYNVGEE